MARQTQGWSRKQGEQAAQRRRFQKRRARLIAAPARNNEDLNSALDWFLGDGSIFNQLSFHGNTTWLPTSLVKLALVWCWSECQHLTDAFASAVAGCDTMLGGAALRSYQGFLGALVTWTPSFLPLLCRLLQQRMQEIGGSFWEIAGFVPLGVDGSRSTAPCTTSNEAAFCAANYGHGKTAKYRQKKSKGQRRRRNKANPPRPQEPQAWITLLWHVGLRLPWAWRLGPSNSSERGHAIELLQAGKFPKNVLFIGDAGFVGYPFWSQIVRARQHFLVRVGGNVRLLKLAADFSREKDGLVLCWPQSRQHEPPLRLRLLKVRMGKTQMWMLTSVLSQRQLSAAQIVRFYRLRWGIEVEFRGLKQTLDRGKLRSRNSAHLYVELDWSILAMAVAELLALHAQLAPRRSSRSKQPPPTPRDRSLAATMRALRRCLRHLNERPPAGQDLAALLHSALTDRYHRRCSKQGRHYRPNPDKKPLGNPKLRSLTRAERELLNQIPAHLAA
jgi:hypothetical protein